MSSPTPEQKQTAEHIIDHLDADENDFSDLGSSIAESDYTSISSSIRDHVYENGRRYHSLNAGSYVIPNDESEQDRLDMSHHALNLLREGELHVARLPDQVHRILDLGTGTGIWAIDMADLHPEATVIGVDLSPIQPHWVPPNCTFEVDDVEKPWLWTQPFDFIHSANIAQGLRNWPAYVSQIYTHLSPGGVVQLYEAEIRYRTDDNTLPPGGAIDTFQNLFAKAGEIVGIKDVTKDLEGFLLDAGFEDVRVVVKKMPIGPWAKDPRKKELGRWGLAIVKEGLKAYGLALFTKVLGMSAEEAATVCDAAYAEFGRGVHTYSAQWFVEGRKPKAAAA